MHGKLLTAGKSEFYVHHPFTMAHLCTRKADCLVDCSFKDIFLQRTCDKIPYTCTFPSLSYDPIWEKNKEYLIKKIRYLHTDNNGFLYKTTPD